MNEYLFLFIHILTNIYFKVNSKYNVKIEKLHSLESIELLFNLPKTKNRVREKLILYNPIFSCYKFFLTLLVLCYAILSISYNFLYLSFVA